jgi:ferredoxin
MEFPRRVFDGEGARADVDFGPTLMLNRNRCILCTRCVRFMREVDGDAQIGIVNRGTAARSRRSKSKGVVSLLSGNLMDVCPVGAITTRDYRFKSRPWDNPTPWTRSARCARRAATPPPWIKAKPEWAKGARLIRMTPRLNPEINSYWMCDIGRFDYHWIESDRRLRNRTCGAARARCGVVDRCARRRQERGGRRRRPPACSSSFGARIARRTVRAAQVADRAAVWRFGWRHREKPQPAARSSGSRPSMRRMCAAPAIWVFSAVSRAARPTRRPSARRRTPDRSRCSMSSIPGPDGSHRRRGLDLARAAVGKIKTLDRTRACCTRRSPTPRHRAAGLGVRREGRDLHEHDGHVQATRA